MSSISFDNPYLLFIALPLVVLFAVPFFIAIRKDNVNAHNVTSGIIHVIMALIIGFVAAGTTVITTVTQTDVYVLADVSYSAHDNFDTIDRYIADLGKSLPDNSRMGVICFGRDYQLLTRLGERVRSVSEANVDDTATDIVGALEFTGTLFRDNVIKRIVVITDGKQTNESDANALKRQVDALADRKIHVDAIYLDDNIKADAKEVQLSGVTFTQAACLGRAEQATVTINCSCPETQEVAGITTAYEVDALVSLYKDGEEYAKQSIQLMRGTNFCTFDLPTTEAGTFDYEVRISAEEDDNKLNNVYGFTQTVSSEMNVLLITGTAADVAEVRKLYGENAEIDPFTYVKDPTIPCTVEELCLYDEIILSNVDATQITNSQMFLESLDTVVSLFGKSLITFGNTYVQGYPTGELRALSDMLPVTYGKSESDPKLYTLVIDNSRSMEYYYNLRHAKEAATEIINMLSDDDKVAVISFNGDSKPEIAPPVQLATGRQQVIDKINSLEVRQGTVIEAGLRAALGLMKSSGYSEKKVLLFSDGLNFGDGQDVYSVVDQLRMNDVTVTTLDVGRGADTGAAATAAKDLLVTIAGKGGGKRIDISSDENLEEALRGDFRNEVDQPGGNSRMIVKRRGDAVLSGITGTELESVLSSNSSYVRGFYFSKAKSSATTVLNVEYSKKISGSGSGSVSNVVEVPLYSYWNYGNGRVASYTSTLTGDWASRIDSRIKSKLFSNVAQTTLPAEKIDYPFVLDILSHDGYVDVTVTPETNRPDASVKITVNAADGNTTESALTFYRSSYNYNFVTPYVGKYTVTIDYDYGNRHFTAQKVINVSYSAEYDSFALYDAAVLHKMVGANGKVSEDGKLTIENDASEVGLYNLSLALPLLIVYVVLYAVDIAVRKLKWEDIQSLFKKVKKGKK